MRVPEAATSRLEVVDRVVAALDLGGGSERAHPADEHVLVVRPVEDADEPGLGQPLLDAPEEVVPQLLGGRRLERRERHALRVDAADDVPHDAALARGVHRLQDQQHRVLRHPDAALGEEPLLQVVELVEPGREVLAAVGLAAVDTRACSGIDVRETESVADRRVFAHSCAVHALILPPRARPVARRRVSARAAPRSADARRPAW